MATGKVHGKVTTVLIPMCFVLGTQLNGLENGFLMACGCALGLIIEPDLDMPTKTESEKRLGIFNPIWFWIWYPYAKVIPHRSFLSHAPFFGTLLRWFYIAAIPLAFLLLFYTQQDLKIFIINNYQPVLAVFIGNAISDIAHWFFDFL